MNFEKGPLDVVTKPVLLTTEGHFTEKTYFDF